ncbi:phosphoribosylglycinamide formyltransferase [Butyrivibrio sp. AE2032]|uniref:phosphoribosylglycinamide formyltransferase n=1 Tax=Butyrivibrio sp. AE2032 TaxID=1458463 RepID=UPI00054E66A6|nr:phosphoribosylglycinamide formyltransferase [Butyrivibrio sp. AE2032]
MKIAVFVSGGGTNLQAIIDNTKDGILKDVEIVLVLSSSKDAYALERAANNGIPSAVVSRKDFDSIEAWDDAVVSAVKASGAELVVLAGYLSLLGPKIVSEYSNRIINIHPALIPSFCGAGMYGIRPHKAALAKGVKVSGATVHFVNENYDEGPILLQKAVEVLPDDTPESLQKRIMKECEWKLLPEAIRLIADGRVVIENNICRIR